jgi:RNA-directed DNA polymerase
MNQKSNMHVAGESDGRTVPTKCPNKNGKPLAEGMEGRRPTKENIEQTTASQTQSWVNASSGLLGVREAAKRERKTRFTALLHHVTVALLLESFYALKRDAAPGVDGVTWKEYETDLDKRLADLHGRVHQGTYRAQPSKRTYIPKAEQSESTGNRKNSLISAEGGSLRWVARAVISREAYVRFCERPGV